MLSNVLREIICKTFENEVGRHQLDNEKPKAFFVNFELNLDWEKEQGHRLVSLLIFAPNRYVAVFYREIWTVSKLNEDKPTLKCIKNLPVTKEKNINKGVTPWNCLCYHDSVWRQDGVDRFLAKYNEKIMMLGNYSLFENNWFLTIDVPEEILKERLWQK